MSPGQTRAYSYARVLCALSCALACASTSGATAMRDAVAEDLAVSAAQITALGIETSPALAAAHVVVDQLLGSIELPVDGTVIVTSPYAGRIARMAVDDGAAVQAGQVLAVVDSPAYAADRARLIELESRARLAHQQAARDRLLAREGIIATVRAAESAATAHELDAARDALAATLRPLERSAHAGAASFELHAPRAGIVVQRHVMIGAAVEASAAAFVLAASTAWRVEVHVPVALGARLGDGARLAFGAFELPIAGRGLALDEQTQTLVVRGVLPPDNGYVPGQQIVASLRLPAPAGALEVPRGALLHRGSGAQIFERTATGFRALPVTVLGETAQRVVIAAPALMPGAAIASRGVSALKALLEP